MKIASFFSIAVVGMVLAGFAGMASARPGDLDREFGDQGVARVGFSGTESQVAEAIDRQADGNLVVAGGDRTKGNSLLARFLENGEPDPAFGDGGTVRTSGNGWTGLDLQPDGKIVVVGDGGGLAQIARFNADGSPDASFGINGVTNLDPADLRQTGFADRPIKISLRAVRVLSDGRIRAIGTFFACETDRDYACSNLMAIGLLADGTSDPAFGDGSGRILLPQSGISASALIQPDGSAFVVRDWSQEAAVGLDFTYTASRVDGSGAIDPAYSGSVLAGKRSLESTEGVITLDSQGRLYVVAYDHVIRFKKTGEVGAYLEVRLSQFLRGRGTNIGGITVDDKNRIVVSGGIVAKTKEGRRPGGFAARMTDNGRPDPTYGGDGLAVAWFAPVYDGSERLPISHASLAPEPDGSVVIAGETPNGNRRTISLARFQGGNSKMYECGGKPADYIGTPGPDEVSGGRGTIVTLGGDDSVVASSADRICTGSGDDKINLKKYQVRPEIWAGAGDDIVRGSRQANVVHGGSGKDRISGGDEDDQLSGGPGSDRISGGGWDDRLKGGSGDDALFGESGRDRLFGGPGTDVLRLGSSGPLTLRYSGKAKGVSTEVIQSKGEAIFQVNMRLHCGRGESRRSSATVQIHLKGGSGKFKVITPPDQRKIGDFAWFTDIKGRFVSGGVAGQVARVESDHWSDNYTCFSGKSIKNLWVPFKANLKPQTRELARQ